MGAVRLWGSYQGMWWRLCYTGHLKKQTRQGAIEYTPRNHPVSAGSLTVTWLMAWFSKCIMWLFLTPTLARLLGIGFFKKIRGYWSSMTSFPFFVAMKAVLDFFTHATCRRFMTSSGCSRPWHSFWRAGVSLVFDYIWGKLKCTSRSTWYHLPHPYGSWATICGCLGLAELPWAEEVGALQSQAAPWSGEQQGYFSSARFALPLLGRGWHTLQGLWCQYSS